jgi:hypothetical protein
MRQRRSAAREIDIRLKRSPPASPSRGDDESALLTA